VTGVRDLGDAVEVHTAAGAWRTARLLLCADAWTNELLAPLGVRLPLVVTQEKFSYFTPADPAAFAVGRFPVWIWMDDPKLLRLPRLAGRRAQGRPGRRRPRGHRQDPPVRP
jgi:glycine/D-amino acid oxidase-like deaminating enzyme